jgi:hypothetical protein
MRGFITGIKSRIKTLNAQKDYIKSKNDEQLLFVNKISNYFKSISLTVNKICDKPYFGTPIKMLPNTSYEQM